MLIAILIVVVVVTLYYVSPTVKSTVDGALNSLAEGYRVREFRQMGISFEPYRIREFPQRGITSTTIDSTYEAAVARHDF